MSRSVRHILMSVIHHRPLNNAILRIISQVIIFVSSSISTLSVNYYKHSYGLDASVSPDCLGFVNGSNTGKHSPEECLSSLEINNDKVCRISCGTFNRIIYILNRVLFLVSAACQSQS